MTRKQIIYQELYELTLSQARNLLTLSALNIKAKKSAGELIEFIHNIHVSIFKPEFVDHDIWFLNSQARYFCQYAGKNPEYAAIIRLVKELFQLVPDCMKSKLEWKGP